jgi:hypothetical protein
MDMNEGATLPRRNPLNGAEAATQRTSGPYGGAKNYVREEGSVSTKK